MHVCKHIKTHENGTTLGSKYHKFHCSSTHGFDSCPCLTIFLPTKTLKNARSMLVDAIICGKWSLQLANSFDYQNNTNMNLKRKLRTIYAENKENNERINEIHATTTSACVLISAQAIEHILLNLKSINFSTRIKKNIQKIQLKKGNNKNLTNFTESTSYFEFVTNKWFQKSLNFSSCTFSPTNRKSSGSSDSGIKCRVSSGPHIRGYSASNNRPVWFSLSEKLGGVICIKKINRQMHAKANYSK